MIIIVTWNSNWSNQIQKIKCEINRTMSIDSDYIVFDPNLCHWISSQLYLLYNNKFIDYFNDFDLILTLLSSNIHKKVCLFPSNIYLMIEIAFAVPNMIRNRKLHTETQNAINLSISHKTHSWTHILISSNRSNLWVRKIKKFNWCIVIYWYDGITR